MTTAPDRTRIQPTISSLSVALLIAGACNLASAAGFEDVINSIAKPSINKKSFFAVVDVKTDRGADVVAEAALSGVKRYASGASANQKIPPAAKPAVPNRMRLVSRGPNQEPQCDGDVANIAALDTSMSKYGEGTFSVVCIFPYSGGYQINYYASFTQRTGGANTNILGAMIGRLVTNAIGLGDSSSFVGKTIEAIQEKLADAGLKGTIVELFPEIKGLQAVRDDSIPMAATPATAPPVNAASLPMQAQQGAMAQGGDAQAGANPAVLPPNLGALAGSDPAAYEEATKAMAELNRRMQEARAAASAQMAQIQAAHVTAQNPLAQAAVYQVPAPTSAQPSVLPSAPESNALQARKDLTAMGLTYHDRGQFAAAIQRGDTMAVKLYIAAQGVDVQQAGADGMTPLQIARQLGRPDVIAALQQAGAR